MKVMMDGIEMRFDEPPELLQQMIAWKAGCGHCKKGLIKMQRDEKTLDLRPNRCWCLLCGQRYYMVIDDLKRFEQDQWEQKAGLQALH